MLLPTDLYRLELHWDTCRYEDNICYFTKAYFSGPVLKMAEKINSNDNILLDFFRQYFVVVDNIYVGKLSWGDVTYVEDRVYLRDCTLTHKSELNKAPKLTTTDYMIIDCKNHDRNVHDFNPNYKTYVVNQDTQVYNYAR